MRETTGVLLRNALTIMVGMHILTLAQKADRERPMR